MGTVTGIDSEPLSAPWHPGNNTHRFASWPFS